MYEENRFLYMNEPYLKGNKEGNRPCYYCFEDSVTGLYWMIPLSSRIDKYKKIMDNKKKAGKPCDIIHIVKLDDDRESAFLIQDMFPITEEYIEREYTIPGHAKDFEKAFGVKRNDVGSYLKKVIQNGTVISNKIVSIGLGRQGYERVYEYKGNFYTMTGIGTNGFIVSAYPVRKDDL